MKIVKLQLLSTEPAWKMVQKVLLNLASHWQMLPSYSVRFHYEALQSKHWCLKGFR